ncbi:MAG: response regulator [Bacteroidetes bacterium]|nr:response regulator [Bacteroidota bacterium]MBK9671643.1 response regulator [Bacteroidota bacterium]MBK9800534.1 response regulator [Bacteroidota bacterium]MBP6412130.1 response regulator [Bacteroidia bacterium]
MIASILNLIIIDKNSVSVKELRKYLIARFGNSLNISSFYNSDSALKHIGSNTSIVILDNESANENANDVLKAIKKINSKTEVIMLSSNENISAAIESFRNGATDFVLKGRKSRKKVGELVYGILIFPLHYMVHELRVGKLLSIFLLTFVSMGLAVFVYLNFFK